MWRDTRGSERESGGKETDGRRRMKEGIERRENLNKGLEENERTERRTSGMERYGHREWKN